MKWAGDRGLVPHASCPRVQLEKCQVQGPEDELDPVPLRNILSQEEGREVSRLFAAMLQLVNDQNVRVVVGDTGTGNAAALQILNLKMRAAQLGDDCSMEVR